MSTYVWCEDSRSGYEFWKKVFETLYKDYIVESKKNNSELCRAVSKLEGDENRYYILMDNAIDNPDVLRETQRLYVSLKNKKNVAIIKIHSFEFVLLSFHMLEDWIFAQEDELKEKRAKLIELKNLFVSIICDGGNGEKLASLKEELEVAESFNTEQLSARILYEITRNTGFETSKSKIGDCFMVNCCDWNERKEDDICGLDDKRITSEEKIRTIYEYSVLKDSFAKAGL